MCKSTFDGKDNTGKTLVWAIVDAFSLIKLATLLVVSTIQQSEISMSRITTGAVISTEHSKVINQSLFLPSFPNDPFVAVVSYTWSFAALWCLNHLVLTY